MLHFFERFISLKILVIFLPFSSFCSEMRFFIVRFSARNSQNVSFRCCCGRCFCCYYCIFVSYSLDEFLLLFFHSSIFFLRAWLVVFVAILNVIRNQLTALYDFDDNSLVPLYSQFFYSPMFSSTSKKSQNLSICLDNFEFLSNDTKIMVSDVYSFSFSFFLGFAL